MYRFLYLYNLYKEHVVWILYAILDSFIFIKSANIKMSHLLLIFVVVNVDRKIYSLNIGSSVEYFSRPYHVCDMIFIYRMR